MSNVFVLQHVHATDDEQEDIKLIGVYSTRELAEAAVSRLSRVSGFCDMPDGFHIDEYQLDRDHWTEGYVAVAKCAEATTNGAAH